MMRMPAAWQRATASATSGRGGSKSATSPSRQSSRSASSRRVGRLGPVGQAPAGDGEHAQALRGVALEDRQHLLAVGLASSGRWLSGPPIARRAAQHLLRRALGVDRQRAVLARVHRRHEAQRRVEAVELPPPALPAPSATSMPSSRAASSIPISVASPRDFLCRAGSTSAVLHDAAARPSSGEHRVRGHGRARGRAAPRGRAPRAASRS